jgi:hypothetical protein
LPYKKNLAQTLDGCFPGKSLGTFPRKSPWGSHGLRTTSAFPLRISIVESLEEKTTEMLVGSQKLIGTGTILQLCTLVLEHLGLTSRAFWLI